MTVGSDGLPQVGLFPFHVEAGAVHLHLNHFDDQLADITRDGRCVFEADEVLATIPSY